MNIIPQRAGDGHDLPTALTHALWYLRLEWPVFPVWGVRRDGTCACRNAGCEDIGKHPIGPLAPHGFRNATLDEDTIRRWWKLEPLANIAIRTGRESGIVVADVDPRHGGDETWAAFVAQHGELDGPRARTGGGGFHVYWRYPAANWVKCRTVARGIDLKADGGYVVAPPSTHKSGECYTWLVPPAGVPGAAP